MYSTFDIGESLNYEVESLFLQKSYRLTEQCRRSFRHSLLSVEEHEKTIHEWKIDTIKQHKSLKAKQVRQDYLKGQRLYSKYRELTNMTQYNANVCVCVCVEKAFPSSHSKFFFPWRRVPFFSFPSPQRGWC